MKEGEGGGISVTGQGMLIMNPGIYYMEGGGFAFTGQGGTRAPDRRRR